MTTSDELIADPIGKFPSATVACFDPSCGELPRRRFDHRRNAEFLKHLRRAGAPAVLIASSTGQGHLRTPDELREWFTAAAQAELGGMIPIALLRPEDGLKVNHLLLDQLVDLGYPVVFLRPGRGMSANSTDREVVENMQPVVAAASQRGLAVGLYSIPDVSGRALSATAAAELVRGGGGQSIVAVKITEADYESSTRVYLRHPELQHLKIVQGWDPHLVRALKDGPKYDREGRQRCGVTSGPMSFAVYQYLHLLAASQIGDWQEVEQAQQAVATMFESMQDDPAHFADLQRAKYIMGLGHPLTGIVTDDQIARVLTAFDGIPRQEDRMRLARSLDLMGDGPYHQQLAGIFAQS